MKRFIHHIRITFRYYQNHMGIFLTINWHQNVRVVGKEVWNETYRTQFIVFIVDFVIVLFIVRFH